MDNYPSGMTHSDYVSVGEAEPAGKCHTCDNCSESIYVGEEYAEIDGKIYCEPCLESMSYKELVELCGYETSTAEEHYE